ncbi:hypothetical protein L208DRAFT_366462 [Tricholoma matsutake]|nr:hypothetical protein L208DRAFT_366462 [Tricholoma matsutake 945]
MIQGQIYETQQKHNEARALYKAGRNVCPKETTSWILASRLEEADGKSIIARSLLEKGRIEIDACAWTARMSNVWIVMDDVDMG